MDYAKLCNALLDSNDKIRYVGVYNSFSGDVYEKMQNGTARHFDKDQRKDFQIFQSVVPTILDHSHL